MCPTTVELPPLKQDNNNNILSHDMSAMSAFGRINLAV